MCLWLAGGILLLAGCALPARAGQTFYVGPNNGTWSNGNNWDAGTPPAMGDDAVVGGFVPGRSGDVNVMFDANYTSSAALNSVTLDTTGATGSVILNQTASSSALYATNEYVGTSTARNIYNQSAGINNVSGNGGGSLTIGGGVGAAGTYNLSGSGNLSANLIVVGSNSGTGTFNQSGGLSNSFIRIGAFASGALEPTNGTFNLSGGSLSGYVGVGGDESGFLNGAGTFNQTGGSAMLFQLRVGGSNVLSAQTPFNSTYNFNAGSLQTGTFTVGQSGSGNLTGTFNQNGTTQVVGGAAFFGPGSLSIQQRGAYNLSGGTLTINAYNGTNGTLTNSGIFTVSGASTINGTFTLTNSSGGTFHTVSTTAAFSSTVTNNGTYLSTGGSKQTFTSLTIGSTGILQATAGETFTVGNNLTNNSTQNTAFNIQSAQLTLSGSGVTHQLAWPGADLGATAAGYQNNFALGILELTSSGSLALLDGNSTTGGGVYVHALMLDGGVAQIANIATSGGLNIYYDPNNATNSYLLGQTYPLSGGGFLEPAAVPEPGSLSLAVLGLSALGWRTVRRTMRCKG